MARGDWDSCAGGRAGRGADVMSFLRRRARPLKWSVVVSSPKGEAGAQWGDTWFAADLVEALNRAGQEARTVFRGAAASFERDDDDVVLVLRGLRRVVPRPGSTVWMLWVISHPELVADDEPAAYDATFAASAHWSRADDFEVPVSPLLQATNPARFSPSAAPADSGDPVLFVGSTRGEFRPAVRDAIAGGFELSVYGVGWEEFLPSSSIAGEFIANSELPKAYAGAGIVLNDHWSEMAREGFLSNRLFDATACATRVISDEATDLHEVFGQGVRTFSNAQELSDVLAAGTDAFPSRADRLELADRVARDHSFDSRAEVLIARAQQIREERR